MSLVTIIKSKTDEEILRLWGLFNYYVEYGGDKWSKDEWGDMLNSEMEIRGLKNIQQ